MKAKRNRLIVCLLLLIGLLSLTFFALAGNLDPNDPPGPTMRTLDEIYSQIAASSSPIKQVVRGVADAGINTKQVTAELSATIDPSKSVVLLDEVIAQKWDVTGYPRNGAHLRDLTPTSITIRSDWQNNFAWTVSYQIIEYK